MYWLVDDEIFIEANWQGLKYCIYDSLDAFHNDKAIFEIDYEAEKYFPDEDEEQNPLEEDRICGEIKEFLVKYITDRKVRIS